MIGRQLGSYQIVEQIGMGGMATVYKAYDPNTDRYVALKVLPEYYGKSSEFYERFRREAKAIAKLEHLHILPVHAYGEQDGIAYLVMRYLPVGTLADRIHAGQMSLDEISRILKQVASALDYAHNQGVLHRDVKPSNLLLDRDGNVFLTDFGIAKMVEGAGDLTGTGILGTPQYMSPEQCRGAKDLTPASDIYSLGVVLYEMVTGRTPFQAETPLALIHMQVNDPLPPPRTLRPDLPDDGERVILKALAKQPEMRFATCSAMAAAFEQAAAVYEATAPTQQSAPSAPPVAPASEPPTRIAAAPTPDTPTTHLRQRRRKVLRLAGVGCGALMFAVCIAVAVTGLVKDKANEFFVIALQQASRTQATLETTLTAVSTPEATSTRTPTRPAETAVAAVVSAEIYYNRGNAYAEQSEYEQAIESYTQALEIDPKQPNAYYNRGNAHAELGDYERAIADYTQVIALDSGYVNAYFNRGNAYAALGDHERAIADYDKVIDLDSGYVDAYYNRGNAYAALGNYERAIADYDHTLELDAQYTWAYHMRAEAHAAQDEIELALADFTEALTLDPQLYDSYVRRGEMRASLGRLEEAIDDYSRAIQLEPNWSWAYGSRAEAYLALEQFELALDDANRAVDLSSDNASLFFVRGEILANLNDYNAALEDFNQAIALEPDHYGAYIRRGDMLLELAGEDRYERAIADYTRAIELDPYNASAYVNRGWTYLTLGNVNDAENDFERALQHEPDNVGAHIGLGNTYVVQAQRYEESGSADQAQEKYDQALATFTAALEIDPENPYLLADFAHYYIRIKDYTQAVEYFEKAIQLDGDVDWFYTGLGEAYDGLGEFDRALEEYRRYLDIAGDNAESWVAERIAEIEAELQDENN